MSEPMLRQRYVDMRNGGFYAWDVIEDMFWGDEIFARITGFPADELNAGLPAERMMAIIHKDDAPHVADGITNSVLSASPFEMVYRIKRDEGYVTVTEIGKCFRQVDGVATLFTGVVFEAGHSQGGTMASNGNIPEIVR